VQNCHPPASVHIVNKILSDFKNHKRDHADFWIQSRGMFIHIRYYAVYDDQNQYLGTLEVTQNIQPLRELTGEKRIDDFQ
ncbi:MAG: PAS domain-containing protein, partial [Limnochordia bacterium]